MLDAGCGVATDGVQFARAGARYTGLDQSESALDLARQRFRIEQLKGDFVQGSVSSLPFGPSEFDLVYSHGVIHHIPNPESAVAEFSRVLRPGGTALVMLYHRNSLNFFTVMVIRRLLAAVLLVPGGSSLVSS